MGTGPNVAPPSETAPRVNYGVRIALRLAIAIATRSVCVATYVANLVSRVISLSNKGTRLLA